MHIIFIPFYFFLLLEELLNYAFQFTLVHDAHKTLYLKVSLIFVGYFSKIQVFYAMLFSQAGCVGEVLGM